MAVLDRTKDASSSSSSSPIPPGPFTRILFYFFAVVKEPGLQRVTHTHRSWKWFTRVPTCRFFFLLFICLTFVFQLFRAARVWVHFFLFCRTRSAFFFFQMEIRTGLPSRATALFVALTRPPSLVNYRSRRIHFFFFFVRVRFVFSRFIATSAAATAAAAVRNSGNFIILPPPECFYSAAAAVCELYVPLLCVPFCETATIYDFCARYAKKSV